MAYKRLSSDLSDADHLPKIGRPPTLTREIREEICRALGVGLSLPAAASLAGVSSSTVYGWLRRGKASKGGGYSGFVKEVEKALARFEARNAAIINQGAREGDWKAALALLERRRPESWAKTEKHEHTGKDGAPVRYEIIREEGADWRADLLPSKPENGESNGNG